MSGRWYNCYNCNKHTFSLQCSSDLIFIDLDARDFKDLKALYVSLSRILKRIEKLIGGYPTVIWSGRGYHIIQPIDCPVNLDSIDKFAALTDDKQVNKEFLQFAEEYLTGNKSDRGHRPSLKSCLLRVPGSTNSKCKDEEGLDPEVKLRRKWNGHRPSYRLLLGSFYACLVGKKQQQEQKQIQRRIREEVGNSINYILGNDYGPTDWVEKLLDTPIEDYRKHTRDLILVPYLVLRRGITDVDKVTEIVMKWADKCGRLRRLDPSRREFEKDTRSRFYVVSKDRIPPMTLEKLKEKNPELHKKIILSLNDNNN